VLSFSLAFSEENFGSPGVEIGAEIGPGQPLANGRNGILLICPVKGKVAGFTKAPHVRGGWEGPAVLVEPDPDTSPRAFEPLDPRETPTADLIDRIEAAGILTNSLNPSPLVSVIRPESGDRVETVVVLASDREPEVSASLRVFKDRLADVATAARLMGRIADAKKVILAVPAPLAQEAARACAQQNPEILSIPPEYPHSLEPLVALKAGGGQATKVVALETAIAALDAIQDGRIQDRKVLTVIGPDGNAMGNYSVSIGTRLSDLFAQVGLEPKDKEKVVAGGPMRGFAQYSLDSAIDAGVDAVVLIPDGAVVDWSDEPCINCGGCIDICPVNLQIQLIGRYAEFELYDRAEELGLAHCIECGLCASVCTARRPLLQLVRLARKELTRQKKEAEAAARAEAEAAAEGDSAEQPEPEDENAEKEQEHDGSEG